MAHNESSTPAGRYTARARTFAALGAARERIASRLVAARFAAFTALALVLLAGVSGVMPVSIAAATAAILALVFGILVRVHGRIRRESERFELLGIVNEVAARRVERRWDALPGAPSIAIPEGHAYAEDLALVGRASLWQLLPGVSPAPARGTLIAWLLAPASPEVVRRRQAAVAELTPLLDFRDDLTVAAMRLEGVPADVVGAANRLPQAIAWVDEQPWLIPAARLLTAASIATWALIAAGVLPLAIGGVPLAACTAFWSVRSRRFRESFNRSDLLATALPWYAELMERIGRERLTSDHLRELSAILRGEGHEASRALRQLRRILTRAEVRYSPMLHIILQAVGLWDYHVASALKRWCLRYGADIPHWFRALGEIEALAAFAGLHHAHPDWCLPTLRDESADGGRVVARQIGHPLLPPDAMVANDLTIGPPGTFVLITGSNMSGKSTLLRAAALNVVMAQAGAPVCATALELSPLRVWTSIRVHDSLSDGVSFFMAELQRLRRIVDAAEEPPPAPPVLYALDEMLQGTNSAERHLAARAVLGRLVKSRGIGLVTTHDVALASAPELEVVARTVYFDESVRQNDDVPLSFDYRLRPGIVPAGNALKLLSLVGLADAAPPR